MQRIVITVSREGVETTSSFTDEIVAEKWLLGVARKQQEKKTPRYKDILKLKKSYAEKDRAGKLTVLNRIGVLSGRNILDREILSVNIAVVEEAIFDDDWYRHIYCFDDDWYRHIYCFNDNFKP